MKRLITGAAAMLFSAAVFSQQTESGTPLADVPADAQTDESVLVEDESLDENEALALEEEYMAWASELWNSLDRQHGEISIPAASASLTVPENFYFLNAEDAETVLVEMWGNPPDESTLGMLFPADLAPYDDESWAVTLSYEEDGYVSDEDADSIDYDEMLSQMQQDVLDFNAERVEMGYEAIELVGWAEPPKYDSETHKLYWAKELHFDGYDTNTLNYNIRALGRRGVLVLNFIANMEQLPAIRENLDTVLAMAEFDTGSAYSDFDPDIDKVAAYGIGALVAGKVLAKTGFLAVALVFLKKFGIFIVIGLGALIKGLFSRKKGTAG